MRRSDVLRAMYTCWSASPLQFSREDRYVIRRILAHTYAWQWRGAAAKPWRVRARKRYGVRALSLNVHISARAAAANLRAAPQALTDTYAQRKARNGHPPAQAS